MGRHATTSVVPMWHVFPSFLGFKQIIASVIALVTVGASVLSFFLTSFRVDGLSEKSDLLQLRTHQFKDKFDQTTDSFRSRVATEHDKVLELQKALDDLQASTKSDRESLSKQFQRSEPKHAKLDVAKQSSVVPTVKKPVDTPVAKPDDPINTQLCKVSICSK